MNQTSFYTQQELAEIGFKSCGENVKISRKASLYSVSEISVGNNVRIDDFCIISGKIELGDYIHISAYTGLFGGETGIICEDYVTISSRCVIYAESDDYSGAGMTNPTIPDEFRNVSKGKVLMKKFSIAGSGTTILPGVTVGEGASVGAMSLVNKNLDEWQMYAGIPVRCLRPRKRDMLEKERCFRQRES